MSFGVETEVAKMVLGGGSGCEVLLVHSSFSGLSRRGLRAEKFCHALLDELCGGTLLMPTMTWRSVTPANPVFDELKTPSHTGVLTEVFRTQFATHRSLHPSHSVAGFGALAEYLLSMHHCGHTPCPGGSPYGLMRDYEARILLLGVGMESCTALHYAEEMIAPDLYIRPWEEAEDYLLIDHNGRKYRATMRRHRRLPRNFPRFTNLLRSQGTVREGQIGDTPWLIFSLKDLYQLAFRALAERKDAMLT